MKSKNMMKVAKNQLNRKTKAIQSAIGPWAKKTLINAYIKSPAKVQFALAKYGIKHVVKKKKIEFQDAVKH